MHPFLPLLLLGLRSLHPASALQASEVGIVDWHKTLIGVPSLSPSTAPTFHRVEPNPNSINTTKSVVLTATTSKVLAALHPDGTVAWRYVFEQEDPILRFQKNGTVVASLSGPGGSTLRTFNSLTGHLILEKRLHAPSSGRLSEPADLGTALAFAVDSATPPSDVFVLTNGHTVRRLDAFTGELKWGWTSPDQTSQTIYTHLLPTPPTLYLLGLSKSFSSPTLHLTSLDSSTGRVIQDADVPSDIADGTAEVLALSLAADPKAEGEAAPHVAWHERSSGTIRSLPLTPSLDQEPLTTKSVKHRQLIDLGLSPHGIFVAVQSNGSARVYKLSRDGGVNALWEYADSADSDRYTPSIYTGGVDKDGRPYVVRVYWSHVLKLANAHVFAPHLADGKGLVTGFTFPFDTNAHGIISHVAFDPTATGPYTVLSRLVLTTTTGAVLHYIQDQIQWTREEGLASVSAAEFVELPEEKPSHAGEGKESFGERAVRHLEDAKGFPRYVKQFVVRFTTGSYESISSPVTPPTTTSPTKSNASSTPSRDPFGFRKLLIVATPFGKLYALDSSNGEIVWSRVLGLGWAAEVGGRIRPVKVYVTRTVAEGESPQVVMVGQRRADNSLVDTVLFHVDALTGEDVRGKSKSGEVLQGLDIIAGPLVESFFLEKGRVVVLVDEFLQVHLYPDSSENHDTFAQLAPSLHFTLRAGTLGQRRLIGHQVHPQPELNGRFMAYSTWSASLPPSEDIQSIITRPNAPVASLGKVLGNRTTLYKYLNPHLVGVLTASRGAAVPQCSIYVMDGVKGAVVYHATVPSTGGACDVKAVLTENWLVYHYWHGDGGEGTKGWRVVSVEFYEGWGVDEKTGSSDLSSYSNESLSLSYYEQTYLYPRAISTLAFTSTKFGITAKDLIVANGNGQIQAFPRRLLDPRRPKGKPSTEEMEEGLIQYDPVLPDDPRRVLSHLYEVANTRHILTTPALLESTSLIFAYGLDLFFTRVTPSGTFDILSESFNKAQLVLTISGLALAIGVTRPMVRRKRLRERWYY